MDLFTQLFGGLLAFVYHCFDRTVIYGYLSGLSRPERVVNFFHQVVGVPVVSREILSQRTADYQNWVEAFARNHRIPIEWAKKGVRKEDHVLPWQRRMVRVEGYGVYCILKSMEQGPSFRVTVPKYPTKDANYRILARQRSRFTHYYFYIRDETLGPMVMRFASFLPFQTTYYLNGHSFIEQELNRARIGFRKTDNAFLAVDDVAALQAAAERGDLVQHEPGDSESGGEPGDESRSPCREPGDSDADERAKLALTDESVQPAVRLAAVLGTDLALEYVPTSEGESTVTANGDVTVSSIALDRPGTK